MVLKGGAAERGGSILVESDGSFHVNGVEFRDNLATATDSGQGGAIHVNAGRLEVISSKFVGNSTPQSGSQIQGGAIYSNYSPEVRIIKSQFLSNVSGDGGGLYIFNHPHAVTEISESHFVGNRASYAGGLYLSKGRTIIDQSEFTSNQVTWRGGAIEAFWTDGVWINNSLFKYNSALEGIAIRYMKYWDFSQFDILNSVFSGNTSWAKEIAPGSVFNYDGEVRMGASNFQNSSPNVVNCALRIPTFPLMLIDLGGNSFDDTSCKFK